MPALAVPMSSSASCPPQSGGTLVSLDGRTLPLRATDLSGRVCGGFGRIVLTQRFVNPHAEPLRVTYQVPLPSDAAVAGFRFRIGDTDVIGQIDTRDRARERFEDAIVHGHTAAMIEQDRSSLFTQEVGNIPPGVEVVVTLEIDQMLRWIADADAGCGGWEWRFPTVVAPRYLGAPGHVADAERIAIDVADRPRPIALGLALQIAEPLAEPGRVRSPSHGLAIAQASGTHTVALADTHAGLDRDIVVRWPVASPTIGVAIDTGRPSADHPAGAYGYGLVTIVPPAVAMPTVARDLIVLLDTSGSMHGEPLAHAKHVTAALVHTLTDRDTLELIEFSNAARRWSRGAVAMTEKNRGDALSWIASLSAGGGTEMRTGILEALAGLRDEAQRQVVLVTDGLIGFEEEVVAEVMRRLPAGSRVHTVGVGSAVNRSLTTPVARAGRGVEVIVGIGEDPERAATRLRTYTHAPLVVDVTITGDALAEHAPARAPDLFAASPALVAAKLRPQGGELVVRGRTRDGSWSTRVHVPAIDHATGSAALCALFGRQRVEDLELLRAAGDASVDATITELGLTHRIATRLTSWIAVSDERTVDPRDPTRRERIPHELPHGMSIAGLGLRGAPSPFSFTQTLAGAMPAAMPVSMSPPAPYGPPQGPGAPKAKAGIVSSMLGALGRVRRGRPAPVPGRPRPPTFARSSPPRQEGARPSPRLRGRIVSHEAGRLIVEIDLAIAGDLLVDRPMPGGALVWPDAMDLRLADGRIVIARIDHEASTRVASMKLGTTLRLVLAIPADATDPRELVWTAGDLTIEL